MTNFTRLLKELRAAQDYAAVEAAEESQPPRSLLGNLRYVAWVVLDGVTAGVGLGLVAALFATYCWFIWLVQRHASTGELTVALLLSLVIVAAFAAPFLLGWMNPGKSQRPRLMASFLALLFGVAMLALAMGFIAYVSRDDDGACDGVPAGACSLPVVPR